MLDVQQMIIQNQRVRQLFKSIGIQLSKTSLIVDELGRGTVQRVSTWSKDQEENPMIAVNKTTSSVTFTTSVLEEERDVLNNLLAIQQTFMKVEGPDVYLHPKMGELVIDFYWHPFFIASLNQNKEEWSQKTQQHLQQLLGLVAPMFQQEEDRLQATIIETEERMGLRVSFVPLNPESMTGITEEVFVFLKLLVLSSVYFEQNQQLTLAQLLEVLLEMVDQLHEEKEVKDWLHQWQDTLLFVEEKGMDPIERMQGFHHQFWENPFQLLGYAEMELSTQLMLSEAIKKGIQFEVIDPNDQIVQLSKEKHIEYVKNTNMTSKDTYIAPLMMENKTATKEVLRKQGFHVPYGKEFSTIEAALFSYSEFEALSVVVKPKTTNFGLGISIFQQGFSKEDFAEALRIAFTEDHHVLVEEFIPGTEYRFYVLDGKVEGVILRVAANVKGDGKHTIEELVALKNASPLRGTGYRRPLQKIVLGEIETLMLKTQGYQVNDLLEKGQVVYLRENSNVSTGGDSIDMTDEMHPSYKQIAVEAVTALGAFVSGIDLMIPDYQKPATRLSDDYGIIEANFNPAIHMHMYPYKGQGRPLAGLMLEKLF